MDDAKYMQTALDLAYLGSGSTFSNPMVGCVIVRDGEVISDGYHKVYGGDHAEIDALRKINFDAKGATMYVTLEPCSHYGKTPPCVEKVIDSGVSRVVVAMADPNPKVNGAGFTALKAAGIEVEVGILEDRALMLNEKFLKWINTSLPFVLLKSAVTLDGFMALEPGVESPLGCAESMQHVHKLREDYDAIAVGIGTVLIDDPRLTCRLDKPKRNPLRVVFDTELRIPDSAALFREDGNVVVFCRDSVDEKMALKKQNLLSAHRNLEILEVPVDTQGQLNLLAALTILGERKITGLMVEGGSKLIDSFLSNRLADKIQLIYTPKLALSKLAPSFFSSTNLGLGFKTAHWQLLGEDAWFTAYL